MSEVSSEILVIALILVLAVVIYVLVYGAVDPSYMKKSVYVGATAQVMDIPRSSGLTDHVITLLPKAGDKFYLTGQKTAGTSGTRTTLKLVTPEGTSIYPRYKQPDRGPLREAALYLPQQLGFRHDVRLRCLDNASLGQSPAHDHRGMEDPADR